MLPRTLRRYASPGRPGVHSLLLGSGGVDGGHQRLLDAEGVVDDLGSVGARQLVVQEALETTSISGVYRLWFTPMTKVGVMSSLAGAEMMTFFAPCRKWAEAFSVVQ